MTLRALSFASIATLVLALSGCSANGRFYPVQGALASQNPVPVYTVKFTAHPPTSLTVTGTIADEQVTGTLIRTLPAPR